MNLQELLETLPYLDRDRRITYLDIGHRIGSSWVYYITRDGKLHVWPYKKAMGDMHGANGIADELEFTAWAAGRIDPEKKMISLRDTSGRYRDNRLGFGRNELKLITRVLRDRYPDFRIIYFDYGKQHELI